MFLPTIKIKFPHEGGDFIIINLADFDALRHDAYESRGEFAPTGESPSEGDAAPVIAITEARPAIVAAVGPPPVAQPQLKQPSRRSRERL